MKNTNTKLTSEVARSFVWLLDQLSPENLSRDGELSSTQIKRKRDAIMQQWRELEAQAGRTVTQQEVYDL